MLIIQVFLLGQLNIPLIIMVLPWMTKSINHSVTLVSLS
jgi:hypothetical protein